MEELVLYEVDDHVAYVTLNRPDRRNGLTAELATQLVEQVERAADDDEARVVVVQGAGTHFCVGADLADSGDGGPAASGARGIARSLRVPARASELLHTMPKVTIAAVQGAAAGAGLGIALACDLRVAATGAVFRTAFLGAGLSGDYGSTWTLTHLLGTSRARALFLLNERLDAAEAHRLGLVHRLVAADELPQVTRELAAELAAGPPLALARMKANLNDALHVSFQQALANEAERQAGLYLTADMREAVAAFVEKRPPRFTGR